MLIEIIIKEIRAQQKMSLQKLEEETGIERHRLAEIENNTNIDNIFFVEMFVIAQSLGKRIEDLFVTKTVELQ